MPDFGSQVAPRDIQLMSVANATLNLASSAGALVSSTLLNAPQEGHIRALNCVMTNAIAGTPGPVTVTIQNRLGKILFAATLQIIATAAVIPIFDFAGIDVQFDQGLFLNALNGSGATYAGTLNATVVWYQ